MEYGTAIGKEYAVQDEKEEGCWNLELGTWKVVWRGRTGFSLVLMGVQDRAEDARIEPHPLKKEGRIRGKQNKLFGKARSSKHSILAGFSWDNRCRKAYLIEDLRM